MSERKKRKIKVFRLNEYEWWAGKSAEDVKKDYLKETGVPSSEAFDEPIEAMSETELKNTSFHMQENDRHGKEKIITFAEELEKRIRGKQVFPCFFATTEY